MDSNDSPKRGRIDRWAQKLLDFSARNRLLNIPRASRLAIRLLCPDVAKLEDALSSGETVRIRSAADALGEKALDDLLAGRMTPEQCRTGLDAELSHRRLCAMMQPREVNRRLADLLREAKSSLEEAGVNTLFLAIGELRWIEPGPGSGRKPRNAPIIMVPVRLERASIADGVKMSRLDEDATVNTTLLEFLRSQFGISVPGVDPLPSDASGVDVPRALDAFREAVKDMDGWEVHDGITLGCFSFGKFVMWKDMTERVDELRRHPLVNHLIAGDGIFDDGIATFPAEDVAKHVKAAELFCPVSYDSSQLAAVLYSELGKTFVLHGPPGTGKSQTITNIIAHNLAKGRRVLFVSEKKAALDVVKARLDKIGLAPFCLELHSNKTEKKRFYSQIKEALDYIAQPPPDEEWRRGIADFERRRDELGRYVDALHRRHPNGLTAYECLTKIMEDGHSPVKLSANALAMTKEEVAALREGVAELSANWRATTPEAVAALEVVQGFEWNPAAEREMDDSLERLSAAIRANGCAFLPMGQSGAAAPALTAEGMRAAAAIAERLAKFPRFLRTVVEFAASFCMMRIETTYADALDRARQFIRDSRNVLRYRASAHSVGQRIGHVFARAMAKGEFAAEDAVAVFDRALAEKSIEEIVAGAPELANFAGIRHDERIEEFRRLDGEITGMSRRMILAKLADALPLRMGGKTPKGFELGILRRECEKKIRHKPVRQILSEAPTLLPALKPCFLMSPLSVAQYLPVDSAPFDLVVFDEASQIPVWDAIGVIARGKQLIVVGDPKQMPPTNFFQKGDGDEDDEPEEEVIEDQESILDECLVAGVFSAHLTWHYRSRHESLISFSNERYYSGKLRTFPAAADSPDLGVKFMFVPDGRFARSGRGARVNEAEARALVDYVCAEVLKPGRRRRSIGMVAFSLPQQRLIQTLLEERRAADPELERLLPEEGEGSYFVKNLENVQGDESDVILFSIGYAPDESGRFTMNFGPLNLSGGERRLNVAVTRAKEQVVVFSSIRGSQIDAGDGGRARSVGAEHLKAFLEYAERGGAAWAGRDGGKGGDAFAGVIADFLERSGMAIERDVGCGECRIDIAVRDPSAPGTYLMGIECDGPSYARQLTVQDRDINRAGALRGLGWRLCRAWSMDWAFDRERAQSRLISLISGK